VGRTYKVGPAGSLGTRYGTVARKQYATIMSSLRAKHECPECHIAAVRRLSVGIWLCGHCGFKFAGGAYVPSTKLGEVAARAARVGVAASLAAELQAEKAVAAEAERKARETRRRRKKAEGKKAEQPSRGQDSEDKAE